MNKQELIIYKAKCALLERGATVFQNNDNLALVMYNWFDWNERILYTFSYTSLINSNDKRLLIREDIISVLAVNPFIDIFNNFPSLLYCQN